MTPVWFRRWVQRPQSLRVRKLLAQVHLWIGIGVGLYILVISISGSAIVFRREIARMYSRKPMVVARLSRRMSLEELRHDVERAYPGYEVYSVNEPERPDRPDRVVLGNSRERMGRLFDPYTGADLGDPESAMDRGLEWLADLHDNLLSGLTGRLVNGIGAFFLATLALTGVVIWWPGIKNWRRSMTVNRRARFPRVNWDVHSAIGFWSSSFILLWGISGFCLCFPGILNSLVPDQVLAWITRLHFGRFGWFTEALWTIFGLAPAILACTGALMWWNRVLRKRYRRIPVWPNE